MKVWNEICRLILGSNWERCLPDGCGLSLPVPGRQAGRTVIRLFACGIRPDGRSMSPPYGYFSVSKDKTAVLSFDVPQTRLGYDPVLPGAVSGNLRAYEMLFEKVMELAFRDLRPEETQTLRAYLRSLEAHAPGQGAYYRALSPEFFRWAQKFENEGGSNI